MDMSAAGYLMLIPCFIISLPINGKNISLAMKYYMLCMLFIISAVMISDLELYKWWGYRMDHTSLSYLKTPWMIFASLKTGKIFLLLLIVSMFFLLFYYFYQSKISPIIYGKRGKWWHSLLTFTAFLFIFIPIRGGFDVAPMNIGNAYFHSDAYMNHAAVNVLWNIGYSFSEKNNILEYHYFPDKKLNKTISRLNSTKDTTTAKHVITKKPNILFIILESFTSKAIAPLGGLKNVTPAFNALVKEGILFDNFYANGSRSDKGLVSIFSGYPSLPGISVTNYHKKTEALHSIPEYMKQDGYNTAFYYGGDIDFANLRAYLLNAGFERLITKQHFPKNSYNFKWGVHDHIMFDTLFDHLNKTNEPFFYSLFTLSSHEPFDVPMETVFKGNTIIQKFKNSVYYTDKCLGEFIDKSKKTDWWDNTLIILVADHGSRLPGNDASCMPTRHKIPMLWLGGALNSKDTIIHKYGSQADIPVTLLHQLDKKTNNFFFGKNILNPGAPSYAFYFCDKGIGFLNDTSAIVYNKVINEITFENNNGHNANSDYPKAILQLVSRHFSQL